MSQRALIILALSGCATASAQPREATPPPSAVEVSFPSGDLVLHGYLWKPPGDGPFPAVIYNHGSEKDPGLHERVGKFFAGNGYVFFAPHRRGHGRSQGTYFRDAASAAPPAERKQAIVGELVRQVDDVVAGLRWLEAQPYVDRSRIAVAGCSFGGIETLLTVERPGLDLRAGVDFAGASMSWAGSPELQARLRQAAVHARAPVFFLQAENDFNTTPTRELSAEMARAGLPAQAKIYPPHGSTPAQGHGGFCGDPRPWGADVLEFLARSLVGRASPP